MTGRATQTIFVFLVQDLTNALVLDLDYPALRKNKNIETFLNKCKSPLRNDLQGTPRR